MNGDYINQLFDKINSRTVNFHESLSRSPECRQVYRYIFPHLMKKIHQHRQNPIAYHQTMLYQDIRGIGAQLTQLNYNPQQIFVYWPRKGVVQSRETKTTRASDFLNVAEYTIPGLSDNEAEPENPDERTPIHRFSNLASTSDRVGRAEATLDDIPPNSV